MKLTLLTFIFLCINNAYSQGKPDSIVCSFEKNGIIEITHLMSDAGSTKSSLNNNLGNLI